MSTQRHSTSVIGLPTFSGASQTGLAADHPSCSEDYASFIPKEERHDLMAAYQKRLLSDDETVSLEAAKRWSVWEESTNRLIQDPEGIAKAQTDVRWARCVSIILRSSCGGRLMLTTNNRAFARIENHYFMNKVCPSLERPLGM